MKNLTDKLVSKVQQLRDREVAEERKQPKNWNSLTQQQKEGIILKVIEQIVRGKEVSQQMRATLPQSVLRVLGELLEKQGRQRILSTRKIPERLKMITDRLKARGLLSQNPKEENPLKNLPLNKRSRQLAAEALELRRQNAIQMVEANKLLPKK